MKKKLIIMKYAVALEKKIFDFYYNTSDKYESKSSLMRDRETRDNKTNEKFTLK